jgi:hypothetical protein
MLLASCTIARTAVMSLASPSFVHSGWETGLTSVNAQGSLAWTPVCNAVQQNSAQRGSTGRERPYEVKADPVLPRSASINHPSFVTQGRVVLCGGSNPPFRTRRHEGQQNCPS